MFRGYHDVTNNVDKYNITSATLNFTNLDQFILEDIVVKDLLLMRTTLFNLTNIEEVIVNRLNLTNTTFT